MLTTEQRDDELEGYRSRTSVILTLAPGRLAGAVTRSTAYPMLSFVPRKVAKALKSQKNVASTSEALTSTEDSKKTAGVVIPPAHQALPPDLTTSEERHGLEGEGQQVWKGKGRELAGDAGSLHDEDYVALLRLTVSEHALWSNPDLRRNLEHSDDGCEQCYILTP